jgi:glycerol-3-phosphate dehydrogenase
MPWPGINGAAIARDAAGRGLSVVICEKDDLASHTSSASTKLIHGGLRYLEYYEFRLVRESLIEREVLLKSAPHIIWPLRFVLPIDQGMRPSWLLRLGLFLYDYMGGRKILPPTKTVNLQTGAHTGVLEKRLTKGFEYSDCWVEDARLVVLNAVDAKAKGADVYTRTEVKTLSMKDGLYHADIQRVGKTETIRAKGVVNAAGPWVEEILGKIESGKNDNNIRLVKGSHIVTKKLYEGDHAYIFQNADDRIIFAIPYEKNFTLIGTTDVPHKTGPEPVKISSEEVDYLCECASEYFEHDISKDDVVWSYSGIRPLFDDKSENASAITRDYVLNLTEVEKGAPLLSVYGGKITTSRKLADHAMEKLEPYFSHMKPSWTREAPLPGGNIPNIDFNGFFETLKQQFPDVEATYLKHMTRAYGTNVPKILANGQDVGEMFGPFMSEAEAHYLIDHELAVSAEDVMWRRTKSGLHMTESERERLKAWFETMDSAAEA